MRLTTTVVFLALMVGACTGEPSSVTEIEIDAPPIPPLVSTTTATSALPDEESATSILGALPDGTPFQVEVDADLSDVVEGISGAVVIDVDGSPLAVGAVTFGSPPRDENFFHHGVDLPPGGGIHIEFYDHILEELGPDHGEMIRASIRGTIDFGLPGLALDPPFRWAADDELPLRMEVQYRNFVVQRGCGELAVACSPTNAVQVIPASRVTSGPPVWDDPEVTVDSPASRPSSDSSYLDPGPLSRRHGADLMWTGAEMIVWGGARTRDGQPSLKDGAIFNPVSDFWDLLPPSPLAGSGPSRAVWAGDQMIVVSTEGTYSLGPGDSSWTRLADGRPPPQRPGRMVVVDRLLYLWSAEEIYQLDLTAGTWRVLPEIFTRWPDPWFGSLRVVSDDVIASWVPDGRCDGRSFAQWTGSVWAQLPPASLTTGSFADCSLANQMGSSRETLVIWEDEDHLTSAYSELHRDWVHFPRIPLAATESPSGPVQMGDDFLVPQAGTGALYDADAVSWRLVDLPGHGSDTEMVWTGEEILAWGLWESFDAWRWSPPSS